MATSSNEKHLLTIAELSAISGLSVITLRRYVRHGKIKALQPGGPGCKLLFAPDALEHGSDEVNNAPERSRPGPDRLPGRRPGWMAPASANTTKL
jgi:hypothetical protein